MKTTLKDNGIEFDYWEEGGYCKIQFKEYPDELRLYNGNNDLATLGIINGIEIITAFKPDFDNDGCDELYIPGIDNDDDMCIICIPKNKIDNLCEFCKELIELLVKKLNEVGKPKIDNTIIDFIESQYDSTYKLIERLHNDGKINNKACRFFNDSHTEFLKAIDKLRE